MHYTTAKFKPVIWQHRAGQNYVTMSRSCLSPQPFKDRWKQLSTLPNKRSPPNAKSGAQVVSQELVSMGEESNSTEETVRPRHNQGSWRTYGRRSNREEHPWWQLNYAQQLTTRKRRLAKCSVTDFAWVERSDVPSYALTMPIFPSMAISRINYKQQSGLLPLHTTICKNYKSGRSEESKDHDNIAIRWTKRKDKSG